MAGTVIADRLEAQSTSQLVIENGVALTPPTIVDVNNVQIGTFCRAWVNFNGTGTVAIRASFNVSSITDNGTGDYTVNFTNAMPDANYSTAFMGQLLNSTADANFIIGGIKGGSSMLVSSLRIITVARTSAATGATVNDGEIVCVQIFR